MKCKDCKLFKSIGDTDKTGHGICGNGWDWQPVNVDDDCIFIPKEYKCKDCQHFIDKDYACMTAEAEDSASNCGGFADARLYMFMDIIIEWKLRGNLWDKLKEVAEQMNNIQLPERKDD